MWGSSFPITTWMTLCTIVWCRQLHVCGVRLMLPMSVSAGLISLAAVRSGRPPVCMQAISRREFAARQRWGNSFFPFDCFHRVLMAVVHTSLSTAVANRSLVSRMIGAERGCWSGTPPPPPPPPPPCCGRGAACPAAAGRLSSPLRALIAGRDQRAVTSNWASRAQRRAQRASVHGACRGNALSVCRRHPPVLWVGVVRSAVGFAFSFCLLIFRLDDSTHDFW